MKNLFSQDSLFSQAMTYFVNIVILNVLIVVCSIPLVTLGASLTAGFYAARKDIMQQGHLTRNFLAAFRSNFRKSTVAWLVLALIGAFVFPFSILLRISALIPFQIVFVVVWLTAFIWVWPLLSCYDNTVSKTLWNALIVGFGKLQYTLMLIAMPIVFCLVVYLSLRWFTSGLFLLALCGVGLIVYLQVKPAVHVLRGLSESGPQAR
ncbi:MAG: YesL family protein [Bifidobacterium sp.]|uniref:YesL family protein n=1 Tax=Bifidobacterium fermentum TaxID=3059035 RepID=A0AB39UHC1_9BIFI